MVRTSNIVENYSTSAEVVCPKMTVPNQLVRLIMIQAALIGRLRMLLTLVVANMLFDRLYTRCNYDQTNLLLGQTCGFTTFPHLVQPFLTHIKTVPQYLPLRDTLTPSSTNIHGLPQYDRAKEFLAVKDRNSLTWRSRALPRPKVIAPNTITTFLDSCFIDLVSSQIVNRLKDRNAGPKHRS